MKINKKFLKIVFNFKQKLENSRGKSFENFLLKNPFALKITDYAPPQCWYLSLFFFSSEMIIVLRPFFTRNTRCIYSKLRKVGCLLFLFFERFDFSIFICILYPTVRKTCSPYTSLPHEKEVPVQILNKYLFLFQQFCFCFANHLNM